ncbi:hypothetical protein [Candidatus Poriferisodalis sp.]|uniref:hypothetical protein n=1 Tax=Candidatus Poriferisodalis sp. TaxID=3101277 RepID=UPI003B5257A9
MTTARTGSVTVRVTCSRSNYTTATSTATFTSREQRVSISGFGGDAEDGPGVLADNFSVSPSGADCTATRVSGITARFDFTDDTSSSRVLEVDTGTATGTITVRVTCTATGYTAGSDTAVFTARPGVSITGYSGASRNGAGLMTASFSVTPSNAACTATRVSGIAAAVAVAPRSGADRVVSVTTTGTGTVQVRLRCTAAGRAAAELTVTFTARAVNLTVTARATSGGECSPDASPPAGADAAWDCWTGTDRALTAVVTATASVSDIAVAWPAASRTGGVAVTASQSAALFDEVTGRYQRSSTASITCTADGAARATTSVAGATAHTAAFAIDCRDPVRITGVGGATGTTAALADAFAVAPANAACTATRVSGIVATVAFSDDSGSSRTVTVTTTGTATGTVTVKIACTATNHAPTEATAAFVRTGACSEALGSLGAGTVTRSGTLAAGCASWKKGNAQSPHWARRYTLTVAAASKLDVGVSSAAADVFVYMLTGTGATATVAASDDDSGTGTDAELSGVALAAGVAYTIEVTTPTANVTGAFTLTLAVTPDKPPVKIIGLADGYGIGQTQAAASDDFTVEPDTAACTATPSDVKISVGQRAARTVSLTRAAPFSQDVTVSCTAAGRSQGTAKATLRGHLAIASLTVSGSGCAKTAGGTADYGCTVPAGGTLVVSGTAQGPSSALSLAWAATGGAAVGSQSQAKAQTVAADAAPAVFSRAAAATVSCTADGTLTLTATAGAHKRTVTVAVACGPVPPAVACDDPLGTLPEGTTARSGTITADADCTTAHRDKSGTFYTRRHTFALDAPAQVTIDVGNDPANAVKLDTYALLLGGHGADGAVIGRDDDGGPSTDSRIAKKLPAGDYTIEATTWGGSRTGAYKLTVDAEHDKHVKISGLAGTAKAGTGAVSVTAAFTVVPAAAACTATPATATITDGTGAADRTVSADITAPGSLAVTVNCTAPGHTASTQTVTLTAKLAAGVTTIGARALGGGECDAAETVPDGVDVAYACTMARGGTLRVEAEATATAAALNVAWAATGGVAVDTQTQDTAAAVVGPDGTTLHRRTAAAALNCTADGTATATATLGGTAKTARLTVTCQPPVSINGLDDTTADGTGQVTVTADFTVTPADAVCTATPAGAAVADGTNPADRTVSAAVTAPGSLDVAVSCTKPGYAPASQQVTLKATLKAQTQCFEDIGVLAPGAVTRHGTIAADPKCTSQVRRIGISASYARRHAFELKRTMWVTVELESAASNPSRLDTYLVLLDGAQPAGKGTVLHFNDDVGSHAGTASTNSRLTGIKLEPGRYTIVATTYSPSRTGNYDLAVSAVTMHGLSTKMHAVPGEAATFVFGYQPADARVTVTGQTNVSTVLSYASGSGILTASSPTAGPYTAKLNIAVPDSGSGHHAAALLDIGGTTCKTGQAVVVGDSVCASPSRYALTISKTSSGSTVSVPAGCVTHVPRGRWHMASQSWPADARCSVPHANGDRPAQFFVFRVYDAAADVTIRLGAVTSPSPQDTYLELYRATGTQTVGGRDTVTVDLDTPPPSSRANNNVDTGYGYLDGHATDSRLQLELSQGVYVVAATVPPATVSGTEVTAVGRFTLNVKIPYPQQSGSDQSGS